MKIEEYSAKFPKIASVAPFVLGTVFGLCAMYLFLQPKLTYQGRTAQECAVQAQKDLNSLGDALGESCTNQKNMIEQFVDKNLLPPNCKAINWFQILYGGQTNAEFPCLISNPSPTSNPTINPSNQNSLQGTSGLYNPKFPWCKVIVDVDLKLGWSLNAIRADLQNKDPECLP